MDALPVFPGRKGQRQRGGGRLADQAASLEGQQQLTVRLVLTDQPVERVAIEQAQKLETFVSLSANPVKPQIWTALICMLLLRELQLRSRFG
jgi:hypothetical protein